jgi:hypothetical protein
MCPRRKTLAHEALVYSVGLHCILLDLKFFYIVYSDSNENRYSLVRKSISLFIDNSVQHCLFFATASHVIFLLDGEYFLLAVEYPQKLTLQDTVEWKCIKYTNTKVSVFMIDVTVLMAKLTELGWG